MQHISVRINFAMTHKFRDYAAKLEGHCISWLYMHFPGIRTLFFKLILGLFWRKFPSTSIFFTSTHVYLARNGQYTKLNAANDHYSKKYLIWCPIFTFLNSVFREKLYFHVDFEEAFNKSFCMLIHDTPIGCNVTILR